MKHVFLLLLALLGLAAGPAAGQPAPGPTGKVLNISDIHFGSDKKNIVINGKTMTMYELLKTLPVSQWKNALTTYDDKPLVLPSADKHDTNYWLLVETLDKAAAQCKLPGQQPDFIVITGDMLAHNLTYKPALTSDFKLMQGIYEFLVAQIQARMPNIPVLPGLGNNDTDMGNRNPPSPKFLAMFAAAWAPLIPPANRQNFINDFTLRGYYSYPLPGVAGNQLIMLNSVLFGYPGLPKYAGQQQAAASTELGWLAAQLASVGPAGHCWLAMHVPHGISAIASAASGCPGCLKSGASGTNKDAVRTMWTDTNTDAYLGAVATNPAVIQAGLSGHVHMDEVRLLTAATTAPNSPLAFLHGTPSVSPYYGNNPAFQVLDYDRASLALLNSTTHYRNLDPLKGPLAWKQEYVFSATYPVPGSPGINLTSLGEVWKNLEKFKTPQQASYGTYFKVSAKPSYKGPLTKDYWPYYWCAIGYTTRAGYCNCLQTWKKNNP